jgi:hypothetical protein
VHQAELFDPATNTWTRLASGHDDRTYHNTAVLLPTGQVLVGGHSPISTMDGYNQTLPGGFSNGWRDPSFELYNPPYLYWGTRPTITSVSSTQLVYGSTITLGIGDVDASTIQSVVLVRNPALTHLVDGDMREVELPIVGHDATSVTVQVPSAAAVLPPGPYMLFANGTSSKGLIPSVAAQTFVLPATGLRPITTKPPSGLPGLPLAAGTSRTLHATPVAGREDPMRGREVPVGVAAALAVLAGAMLAMRRRLRETAGG